MAANAPTDKGVSHYRALPLRDLMPFDIPLLVVAMRASPRPLDLRGVRTGVARPVRTNFQSMREPLRACRRCSIARSPGFPFPPLALVPNEAPAAIPAGVSPCLRGIWFAGADAAGPRLLPFTGRAEIPRARRGEQVQRWYVTFHGGKSSRQDPHDKGGSRAWNNIHVFGLDGTPKGKALDTHTLPDDLDLRELRGFAFGPDGDLYVANAYKDASQVLRFAGKAGVDGKHPFREVYAERHEANPGLAHPFAVAFGPDSHLYVPSQDSNIVGRYYGPHEIEGKPGTPMPHPVALQDADTKHLLPGTFIPSHKHAHGGLHAVRGAIFGPDGDLYVADRDADSVKRYDGDSGEFRREFRHPRLSTPVHLAFRADDGALLVGSRDGNAIVSIDPKTGAIATLIEPGAGGLRAPAGMAFDLDGRLYVSSRETRQILRFDASTGTPDSTPFIDDLDDFPEFIALVEG